MKAVIFQTVNVVFQFCQLEVMKQIVLKKNGV